MGIRLYKEPKLEKPVLIASWPGIGNIGIIAVDTLRGIVRAEELGEIEAWDFFYPSKVLIRDGELKDLEFPSSKFYFKRTEGRDLLFFYGGGTAYRGGQGLCRRNKGLPDGQPRFRCGLKVRLPKGLYFGSGRGTNPSHL